MRVQVKVNGWLTTILIRMRVAAATNEVLEKNQENHGEWKQYSAHWPPKVGFVPHNYSTSLGLAWLLTE